MKTEIKKTHVINGTMDGLYCDFKSIIYIVYIKRKIRTTMYVVQYVSLLRCLKDAEVVARASVCFLGLGKKKFIFHRIFGSAIIKIIFHIHIT